MTFYEIAEEAATQNEVFCVCSAHLLLNNWPGGSSVKALLNECCSTITFVHDIYSEVPFFTKNPTILTGKQNGRTPVILNLLN